MKGMEFWNDSGIILKTRPYGEGAVVVTLLTSGHGKHAGYVYGGQSGSKSGMLATGNLISVEWKARLEEQLGSYAPEMDMAFAANVMDDRNRLTALLSACSLCDVCLAEREVNTAQFEGLKVLLSLLGTEAWAQAYIMWEIAFMRELGYPLDLAQCAATGMQYDLVYVSPKTGKAVSKDAGEPYKDKMLPLPSFLRSDDGGQAGDVSNDIVDGLNMTGHFLQNWVLGDTTAALPEARTNLLTRMEKSS